jgi:hypothetical protein
MDKRTKQLARTEGLFRSFRKIGTSIAFRNSYIIAENAEVADKLAG